MRIPTQEDCFLAKQEGIKAAVEGYEFADPCPYTYNNFPGMTYREFDNFKRPLMNAWFDGWKAKRDQLKEAAK